MLLHQQIAARGLTHLTIDIDATIIPSGKKECLPIYRAATGQVPYEKGFQPMMGLSPELGLILHTEMRDGNVPASQDILRFLVEILAMLPASITSVLVRMDSAGYQHEFMNYCNGPLCRRPGHNLALRFFHYRDDTLRCLHHPLVPATNNLAERDIRPLKIKQKISGSFRTKDGARDFAVLRSVLETARKRQLNALDVLGTNPSELMVQFASEAPAPDT